MAKDWQTIGGQYSNKDRDWVDAYPVHQEHPNQIFNKGKLGPAAMEMVNIIEWKEVPNGNDRLVVELRAKDYRYITTNSEELAKTYIRGDGFYKVAMQAREDAAKCANQAVVIAELQRRVKELTEELEALMEMVDP